MDKAAVRFLFTVLLFLSLGSCLLLGHIREIESQLARIERHLGIGEEKP